MGQRTAIIIKRNFADGTKRLDMLHEQWGNGKVMPITFMRDLINLVGYDKSETKNPYHPTLKEQTIYRKPRVDYDYIIDGKSKSYDSETETYSDITHPADMDVWDFDNIDTLFDMTDNNNGGMIIEVTEKASGKKYEFNELCSPEEYDKSWLRVTEIKIGFLKGSEDTAHPFEEIVTAEEYMAQFPHWANDGVTQAYNGLCEGCGVIQVTKTKHADHS